MTARRILVAGIGNVFMGDDGFGVAVARELAARSHRDGVVVMDAGIRGIDLTYALTDGYDAAILVDAAQRGRAPGTLYVIEPEVPAAPSLPPPLDAHGLDPASVLLAARALGAVPAAMRLVACEPAALGTPDDPVFTLSPTVRACVTPAVRLVESIIDELGGHAGAAADA